MAAEQVTEVVADHIEEVAEVTRHIDPRLVKYFLGGVGVGAVIGFFVGYRFNREKIKAQAFKDSEAEIQSIREHYQRRLVAKENEEKKEMTDIVVEEGYAEANSENLNPTNIHVTIPLTVPPDLELVPDYDLSQRPLKPTVPVDPAKPVHRTVEAGKDKMSGWNYPIELAGRTPDKPHIIHQDEFHLREMGHEQTTYVYFAGDDVLVDEDKSVISDREAMVGTLFHTRFGHGSDDANIVYVRNPVLELDIEICRSPGSYEEEVLGLENGPQNDTSP